jgi:glycine cleavage system H protein
MRKYSKTHEWYEDLGGGKVKMGVTQHAATELSDIVFVELPDVGKKVAECGSYCILESVKAVSDLYGPAGTVVEVNNALKDKPVLVNESPEGEGWIVVAQVDNPGWAAAYMDEATYLQTTK